MIGNDPTWRISKDDSTKLLSYAKWYSWKWDSNNEIPRKILFGQKKFFTENHDWIDYYISEDRTLITWGNWNDTYVWKITNPWKPGNRRQFKSYNDFNWTIIRQTKEDGEWKYSKFEWNIKDAISNTTKRKQRSDSKRDKDDKWNKTRKKWERGENKPQTTNSDTPAGDGSTPTETGSTTNNGDPSSTGGG